MKRNSFSILLAAVLSLFGIKSMAYDIAVENTDGVTIYYNYINNGTELEVTSGASYSGDVSIPEEVTFMNSTRKVTSIGETAFSGCSYLTSVTIPNSVTSIGEAAFYACHSLTAVTIPNNVTSIDIYAFGDCPNLTSITVKSGNETYDSRNNCNAIIETASNTLIIGCKKTIIPSSVKCIGRLAFGDCLNLTSIIIPNGVTSIKEEAFHNSGLTTITIPNSVTSIGFNAFVCENLREVISKIENPFIIEQYTFGTFVSTLYVPANTIEKYKATVGWTDFVFIEEDYSGDIPEPQQCATPTIAFVNGKVRFDCETEGVEFVSSVTSTSTQQNGNELELGATFTVSVFATKEGYFNSDVATATIDLSNTGDVNGDGEVNVSDVTTIVSIILGNNP